MRKFLLYALLVAAFCITLSFWWQHSGPLLYAGTLAATLLAFGRLTGQLATMLILLQLVLIGRVKWVETVFGLDKLSRIHRLNGYIILGLILMHPTLMTLSHSLINGTTYLGQLQDFLVNWDDIMRAFIGYLFLLFSIGISISIVRRRLKYETWYYVHFFNYLAIVLIFGHQFEFGTTQESMAFRIYWYALYAIAFGNIAWFRFIRPTLRMWKHDFTVARVEPAGPATSIYITGKHMDQFKFKPGQFNIYRFLQAGFWTQAHPFSLSEAPNGKEIRITAKKLGDYTNQLPNLKPGTKVVVDGPHGVFTPELISKDKVLFMAGGIGITPIFSMLEAMGKNHHDAVLLYSNKSREETVFGQELDALSKQNGFKIINILSNEAVPGYEHGMLDEATIARLVPDVKDREIFLCGPPPMMLALRKALQNLGVPSHYIHFERFAL